MCGAEHLLLLREQWISVLVARSMHVLGKFLYSLLAGPLFPAQKRVNKEQAL